MFLPHIAIAIRGAYFSSGRCVSCYGCIVGCCFGCYEGGGWCHGWIFGCCLGWVLFRVLFWETTVDNRKRTNLHIDLGAANLAHKGKPLLVELVLMVK